MSTLSRTLTRGERATIRRLYVDDRRSLRQTAAAVGRSVEAVRRYLAPRGLVRPLRTAIRVRHQCDAERINRGVHLYHVVRMTLGDAAGHVSIAPRTLGGELRRRGLMRSRSEETVLMHARRASQAKLWERRGRVFDLYTINRLSYREIADRLGIGANTVETDLRAYRKRFGADAREPGRTPASQLRHAA